MSALAGSTGWRMRRPPALGAQLATLPYPQVVYLHGDLGAGKTTLARGTLRALGYEGAVRSPTYTLLERYELGKLVGSCTSTLSPRRSWRLHALGLRELLEEAAMLFFEWPERGKGLAPGQPTLRFELEGDGRRVHGPSPALTPCERGRDRPDWHVSERSAWGFPFPMGQFPAGFARPAFDGPGGGLLTLLLLAGPLGATTIEGMRTHAGRAHPPCA